MKSRYSTTIPSCSVPSFLFNSPTAPLPEEPLIIDPVQPDTHFLTLSSYRLHSQRFAAGLRRVGFQTGDRLMLVSSNSLAFPIVYAGTLMAGGVFSGANPTMDLDRLSYQVRDLGCRLLLASAQALDVANEAARAQGLQEDGGGGGGATVYLFDRDCLFPQNDGEASRRHGQLYWGDLLVDGAAARSFDWNLYCEHPADQLAVVNYTSGSTGPAKGVMVTHRNLVANSAQFIAMAKLDPDEETTTQSIRWVGWLAMFHNFGQTQYLITGPKRGIKNYLLEVFSLEELLKYIERYRATQLFVIPSIVLMMIHDPAAKKYDLSSLASIDSGGSPLRRPICERLEAMLPNQHIKIKQGWGMTELAIITKLPKPPEAILIKDLHGIRLTCIVLYHHPLDTVVTAAIGELLPNCEGKIVSLDGTRELQTDEIGEAWIRAPNVTKGYWNLPDKTRQVYLEDGWIRTGDLGYYDAQGKWYIVERIQEVIHSSDGHAVIPAELESFLLDIPGVVDAGVVAVHGGVATNQASNATHEDISETLATAEGPRAYVVLDGSITTPDQVLVAFHQRAKPHQSLSGGLTVLDEIPKLPGAKVDRHALRQRALKSL